MSVKVRVLIDGTYNDPHHRAQHAKAGDLIEVAGGSYRLSLVQDGFVEYLATTPADDAATTKALADDDAMTTVPADDAATAASADDAATTVPADDAATTVPADDAATAAPAGDAATAAPAKTARKSKRAGGDDGNL